MKVSIEVSGMKCTVEDQENGLVTTEDVLQLFHQALQGVGFYVADKSIELIERDIE